VSAGKLLVQETPLLAARRLFEEWAQTSMEYLPPHMCEAGEPSSPQPGVCIPCNTVKTARELVAAEREAIASFIERTFGRMSLATANGYVEGRDLAAQLRAGLDVDAAYPAAAS
jgi:hypothetical protein